LRYLVLPILLLAACTHRPYVEILEPADEVVVTAGATLAVLAYAWDKTDLPEELRVEAWFGADPVTFTDASSADTGTDTRLRWVTADLSVDHTDELRIVATSTAGEVDVAEILICTDATDCGEPEATVVPEDGSETGK
jgi:hypothetical protein